LASRLRALSGTAGSMEYVLTWSEKATPLGRRYLQQQARARRTSANACSGWPTPKSLEDGRTLEQYEEARQRGYEARKGKTTGGPASKQGGLAIAVQLTLAGWPTPTVGDSASACNATAGRSEGSQHHSGTTLTDAIRQLSGWATPSATDYKGSTSPGCRRGQLSEQTEQGLASGTPATCSPAATTRSGVLNPAFSLWLMGYGTMWLVCLPTTSRKRKKR
jgi:hypothetical protein